MKFELDNDESARFKVWDDEHLRMYHNGNEPYAGAIGGRVSFVVTGTSLGQILSAKCNSCEAKNRPLREYSFCLTDFNDW